MAKNIVSAVPGGAGITWEDWKGKLIVIEPLELEHDVKTIHGVTDAVRGNVYVLTGPGKSEDFEDTLIFPKILQSQTRRQIGKLVVGRLTQGEAQKGKNAPWQLAEATPADLQKASTFWLAKGSADVGDDADEGEDDEDSF